jgi:ssDNA-binding Zn-finger/Zn-ribbon topoisomerase 1
MSAHPKRTCPRCGFERAARVFRGHRVCGVCRRRTAAREKVRQKHRHRARRARLRECRLERAA